MKRPNWSERRTIVIAGVLAMVVALLALITFVAVGLGPRQKVGPSPAVAQASPATIPQLVMQRHADRDGRLDFEGTLEMFSYAFEPLPGVSVPPGPADDPAHWTDLAMGSILPHSAELTAAQRGIVASYLVAARSVASRHGDERSARLISYLAAVDQVKVQVGIETLVQTAIEREAKELGHTLADPPVGADPGAVRVVLAAKDLKVGNIDAPAWTVTSHGPVTVDANGEIQSESDGKVTICTIFIGPSVWKLTDAGGAWNPDELQIAEIYHEVFHCYQGFVIGSQSGAAKSDAPSWVIEGGADWAASSVLGFDEPAWARYLSTPATPLAQRSYDAFGLLYEMEYVGPSLWPDWWRVWTSAASGGWGTTDWFNAIAGARFDAVRTAWAASYFQDGSLGHDWTEVVAGQTTAQGYSIKVPFDGQLNQFTNPYSTLQVVIPPQADGTVVTAIAFGASGRWIDRDHYEQLDTKNVRMCWGGASACTCPGGGGFGPDQAVSVRGGVSWAMTTLADVGNAVLTKQTRDQYCKKPTQSAEPPPPPPPCHGGCPGSNGDPHLHTVNGRQYVFQAAGEYTLLRSADRSVEVQARQEPLPGSVTSQVTINTALAVRFGTHRVGIYVGSSGLEVHIDGRPVTPSGPVQLDGGGTVTNHPNGVQIDIPGGTTLWALSIGRLGISVQLAPSPDLASTGVGLLGSIPPGYELPRLPDGSEFPFQSARAPAARYAYLYGPFAAAWRVTDQTSLFDYAGGATTASYDVPGFLPEGGPQVPLTLDPVQRAAAEQSCTGVDDVELRNDCVYDVTVTHDTGFVAGYQSTAAFQATGVTALDGGAPAAGASGPPSAMPTAAPSASTSALGQLVISRLRDQVTVVRGTVLSPSGTLYVMVEETDRTEILTIDPTQNAVLSDRSILPPTGLLDGLAFAGDALWAVERSGTGGCSVTQAMEGPAAVSVAPVTLTGCPDGSPVIAATTDAIWVQDGPSSATSRLDRIDPATGKVTGSIALPPGGRGALSVSPTSAFWSNSAGVFRIDPSTNTAVQLGPAATTSVPSGDSIWVQRDAATTALLGASGSTKATLTVDGSIAGADATDLFVARPSPQGGEELWRYPVDGTAAVLLAPAASDTGVIPAWAASATARAPLLVGEQFVIQAIAQSPGSPQPLALQLEIVQIK